MLKSRAGLKMCNKRISQGTRDLNELKYQSPWRDKGRKKTEGQAVVRKGKDFRGELFWVLTRVWVKCSVIQSQVL